MNKSRVNRIIGVLAFALITAMASLLFVGYSPTVEGTTKHLPVDSASPFTPEVALPKVIATIPLGVNASPSPSQ